MARALLRSPPVPAMLLLAACSPAQPPAVASDPPDASAASHEAATTAGARAPPEAPISTTSLRTLASVRPMGDETVAVFRRANAEGYFGIDATLLADNGSPKALDLLGEMLTDRAIAAPRRVDGVHLTVYPHRLQSPMLRLAGRLLAGNVDDEAAIALVESIFDDGYVRWFPPSAKVARPPPWERASPEAAQLARGLAAQARARGRLPAPLLEAITRTEGALRALPAER